MSAEENKAFMRRYFDAMNRDKSPATVSQYVTDEGLRQHIAMAEAAFPGYQLTAEDMIAEGDRVAVRATGQMIHAGEFMGIPPTGKQVTLSFIAIYRITGDKITEFWIQADSLGLLQQLGVIPTPGQAPVGVDQGTPT